MVWRPLLQRTMNYELRTKKGKAHKFGDSISTDHICPGKYYHLRSNLPELAKHVLEDANPEFPKRVKPGDFVVAGRNFGLGSSREHAPLILKITGVQAVLAKSFARIFFRNAINIGLPVIECDTDKIKEGDSLEMNFEKGTVTNLSHKEILKFKPLSPLMREILREGGVVQYLRKHKSFQ